MNDTVDELCISNSAYVTPPLSPSKTISTEGWTSPRTPRSSRKVRSCSFLRDVDDGVGPDSLFLSSSVSPTKLKSNFTSRLGALSIPEIFTPVSETQSDDDSPIKRTVDHLDWPPLRRSISVVRPICRSFPPGAGARSSFTEGSESASASSPILNVIEHASTLEQKKWSDDHRLPNGPATERDLSPFATFVSPSLAPRDTESPILPSRTNATSSNAQNPPTILRRLPLRASRSPLRPSQWVTRGGLLSSPKRAQSRTPDRFISIRRSPHATRESFELNKPAERLAAEERISRGGAISPDPFSRRVRRTGRLNDELRSLRETYSLANQIATERANLSRRDANLNIRRNSWSLGGRQLSAGAIWNVGGSSAISDTVTGVSNGRGGMFGSRTNAPLYTSTFLDRVDPEAELEAYERRLALALDVDRTDRILQHTTRLTNSAFTPSSNSTPSNTGKTKHVWCDTEWTKEGATMLLDAPQLRDDYYCSLLTYSHTAKVLAVGLGNFVHLWSERKGVDTPDSLNALTIPPAPDTVQHVTSLSFSSNSGGQAILAVGRADGRIALWSPFDSEPRFNATQPKPISCVSFRPTTVLRPSLRDRAMIVPTEELLIGDEAGHIYFYSVEWPSETNNALFGWHGAMTLLARMTIHTQQICGLAWSPDGQLFASGGNDNACYLFETKKILHSQPQRQAANTSNPVNPATTVDGNSSATSPDALISAALNVRHGPHGETIYSITPGQSPILHITPSQAKHSFHLTAAIKAIAFCPWQRGLLAIGGGSNDRCIHFYHTHSGSCLATIDCAAQVTSLIWSSRRKEIAATFGFAQPEHPYRVAVFEWPSCRQVAAVPWWDESRALYAVAYPDGPDISAQDSEGERSSGRSRGEDGLWSDRGREEGCIVVAASDMAIRFHEIWTGNGGRVSSLGPELGSDYGGLGGSDILEGLHGAVRGDNKVIR